MFRALALVLWLLIAFSSVFYIVNALHQRESEIRQEFNLSSDQAQRFIQRTSDVMKELKYIAENRLSAENGVLSPRGRETQADVPAFEPLFADSDCSAACAISCNDSSIFTREETSTSTQMATFSLR